MSLPRTLVDAPEWGEYWATTRIKNLDKTARAPRRLVEKTLELLMQDEPEGLLDLSYFTPTPAGGFWQGKRLALVEVPLGEDWAKWGLEPPYPRLVYRLDEQKRYSRGEWGEWAPIEAYRATPEKVVAWTWQEQAGFWRFDTARSLWLRQVGLSESELGEITEF